MEKVEIDIFFFFFFFFLCGFLVRKKVSFISNHGAIQQPLPPPGFRFYFLDRLL